MKENSTKGRKRCPLCKRVYPEENNFCRRDGTRLEPTTADWGAPIAPDQVKAQTEEERIEGS